MRLIEANCRVERGRRDHVFLGEFVQGSHPGRTHS